MKIPTYIINLETRTDRREHIEKEFRGRNEFSTKIVPAHTHEYGAIGLWNTIRHIIGDLTEPQCEFVLICEDDHIFTESYNAAFLQNAIEEAKALNADVLSGGVSWFEDAVQISEKLFWMKQFSGTQFIIIFRKFFQAIVNADFTENDIADYKMASLSDYIYFMHPFISEQKEFGYSDATARNNGTARVEALFSRSSARAGLHNRIRSFYNNIRNNCQVKVDYEAFKDTSIPTYIINLPERIERREHIIQQFESRTEFNITIVEACKHDIGFVGLWLSFRKVIRQAIDNDDDVIIVCEDDHEFTPHYSKDLLFEAIFQAHCYGCDYLNGGTGKFWVAVPVSGNLFWSNHFLSTQFIVVFRKFFQKVLDEPFDETIINDIRISQMTGDKMIIFPFISNQKDFGYSDVTPLHNAQKGIVQAMFNHSSSRLEKLQLPFLGHSK